MSTNRRNWILALFAATAFFVASGRSSFSADLKYATFANVNHPILTKALVPFFDRVKAATGGGVKGVVFPNGQLLGARAILGGIEDKVVDAGYIMPSFYPSDLRRNLALSNMVAYGEDPLAVTGAVNEMVLLDCPTCQQEYGKHGSQVLVTFTTTGYKFMCRKRIETLADLAGKRIRSTGIFNARVQDLGAVPVDIPVSDAAEAIERGGVDCVLGPLEWLQAYGLQDSVKYVTEVSLGLNRNLGLLVANTQMWAKMAADDKKKVVGELAGLAADSAFVYVDGEQNARKIAKAAGVEFLEGDKAFRSAAMPDEGSAAEFEKSAKALGVTDGKDMLLLFQKKLEKWEKIVASTGHDRDKYAAALKSEIFDKL